MDKNELLDQTPSSYIPDSALINLMAGYSTEKKGWID
jgi:hypothetical protein